MTQQGVQLDQEQFCCSICLHLLKDPVTVPCGHNYCSGCIEAFWTQGETQSQRGTHSCPQCRQTFTPRPILKKNTMLAEVVEKLKETGAGGGLQDFPPPPDSCHAAGPGDVPCDVCTGRKLKAVTACLQCLASYCDAHLQPHHHSPAFRKHKLVKAPAELQKSICPRHDEAKNIFCHTDQRCICYLCSMEEHRGHDTVPAAAERAERQKELDVSRQRIQQRIQERETDVKALHQEVRSINGSADRAVENSDSVFTELITSMVRRRSEVRELIREQQRLEVNRAKELRRRMDQEVTELRTRHAELVRLLQTEDHVHFLQRYGSLSAISESSQTISSGHARPLRYFEDVTAAVSRVRDTLKDVLQEEGTNISKTVNRVDVLLSTPSEPRTRPDFLQYSCPITLDPNTANQYLTLSKGNRYAMTLKKQSHRQHPERFMGWCQVLCKDGLTGRTYWEVEWHGDIYIAVSYKDIGRRGNREQCVFGFNDKSWCLHCCKAGYDFMHGDVVTKLPAGRVSSRVGVYLDREGQNTCSVAGTLSFYAVSDTVMTLLHRVHTTFTQALYPGFRLLSAYGDTVELCDLK